MNKSIEETEILKKLNNSLIKRWTKEEDIKFIQAVENYGLDWKKIAKQTNKTQIQCKSRGAYLKLKLKDNHNTQYAGLLQKL